MEILNQRLSHKYNNIFGSETGLQIFISQLIKHHPETLVKNGTKTHLIIYLPNEKNDAANYKLLDNGHLKRDYDKPDFSATTISDFLLCQKKHDKLYNTCEWESDSLAFQFGSFVHEKLSLYPNLVIDENERPELKSEIGIKSWKAYFELIYGNLNGIFKDYEIIGQEEELILDCGEFVLHGTIDIILRHKVTKRILVVDYKTYSRDPKLSDDIYTYIQVPIYGYLWSQLKGTEFDNIDLMYISVPKQQAEPKVLQSGKLSKDKSQKIDKTTFLTYCAKNNINFMEYIDFMNELPLMFVTPTEAVPFNAKLYNKVITTVNNVYLDSIRGRITEQQGYMCGICSFKERCKL